MTLETRTAEPFTTSEIDVDQEQVLDRAPLSGANEGGFDPRAGVALGALALAACGGEGDGENSQTIANARKPETEDAAARFILQAGTSVTDDDIQEVMDDGFEPWLNRQIGQPIRTSAVDWMVSRDFHAIDDNNFVFNRTIGDYAMWNQLLTRENMVRKRVALALSEFFVVGLSALNFDWRAFSIARYWDILAENAFGSYRELLEEVTLSTAMGAYLNTKGNRKGDERSGREPDENYSREVMQLFSIGLFELNQDGTPKLDAGGNPIETYTNDDVIGLARVMTGYEFDYGGLNYATYPLSSTRKIYEYTLAVRPMTSDNTRWRYPKNESQHSAKEKTFLGTTIAANTGPEESMRIALDVLADHPNTGPFFAKQMIQRLVTSNPSPEYVSRVAGVFNDNGSGQRGDLRAVFKAILLDDEALSTNSLSDPRFGKMREPMLRMAQWAQTFGATSESRNWEVRDLSSSTDALGQSPMRSPSVFNFFRPGFIPPNSNASANDLAAPEFALLNESSIAGQMNFLSSVIEGRQWRTRDLNYSYEVARGVAHDPQALLDWLDLHLAAGQLSDESRSVILTALQDRVLTSSSPDEDKDRQIQTGVMLVMASPDYVIQK